MASLVEEAFTHRNGELHCEGVPLTRIAEQLGTPCWVYSRRMVLDAWSAYDKAFADHPHMVCYAVKANGSLALLQQLARAGAGFDIVSGGELHRVLAAGADPSRVVFSGVCKTDDELNAALRARIRCFNVESAGELERLATLAEALGVRAPVALRVNPDIDVDTHPYIATGLNEHKFGVPMEEATALYDLASRRSGLLVSGVACHIGSQIRELDAFARAARAVAELADALATRGITVDHLDLGGGLGLNDPRGSRSPGIAAYVQTLIDATGQPQRELMIEPGRSIVAEAGMLLTRVHYVKRNGERVFALTDAGMNDFLRPALYRAEVPVVAVRPKDNAGMTASPCDIVGPVCESADFMAQGRELAVAPGQLLAIGEAGAYGASMSSHYNARPLAAEVLVDGDQYHVIRRRESLDDLLRGEQLLELPAQGSDQ